MSHKYNHIKNSKKNNGATFTAKITRPIYMGVLNRTRLFDELDDARCRAVTWITAPAGAGKTALVSGYVQCRGLDVIWYRIDGSDGDPASFFHFMGLAANVAMPAQHHDLTHLTPHHMASVYDFAQRFFDRVLAQMPRPGVIVFDDCQDLPNDALLHRILARLFERLPEGISAVVLSRAEPPADYASLKSRDAISYVAHASLKFTLAEVGQYVQPLSGERFAPELLIRLYEHVDGWPAGLVLLREHVQGRGVMRMKPGIAPKRMFDYLAGDFLIGMDGSVQRSLVISALLPNMTPRAVVLLTENPHMPRILRQLCLGNYFTVSYAAPVVAYQYHPLFRAFLLARAEAHLPPMQLTMLKRRAAEILAADGNIEDARDLFRATRDWPALRNIVVEQAQSLTLQGRVATLQQWLGDFPDEFINNDAWRLYWRGICRMAIEAADSHDSFASAYKLFEQTNDVSGLYLSWAGAVESLLQQRLSAPKLDDWLDVFDALCQAHPTLPSVDIEARVAYCAASSMIQQRPDHPRFTEWLTRAIELLHVLPDINARLKATNDLGYKCTLRGDYPLAQWLCAEARMLAQRPGAAPSAMVLSLNVRAIFGWLHASKEQWSSAVAEVLRCEEQLSAHRWTPYALLNSFYGQLIEGDEAAAAKTVERLDALERQGVSLDPAEKFQTRALLLYYAGDVIAALGFAQKALEVTDGKADIFIEAQCQLTVAQIHFELGQDEQAWRHLIFAKITGERMQSRPWEEICALLEARMCLQRNQLELGLKALRRALSLNRQLGGVSYPYFTRPTMTRLYTTALRHGVEVDHVQMMIRRRKLVPETPPLEVESWPWVLKIYTLGRFCIIKDDQPVAFSGKTPRKPLDLLKLLISLGGRDISLEKLADTLWPDTDGDAAQCSLKTTVHRLRKLLGNDNVLIINNGQLTLDGRLCWIDAWAFERVLSRLNTAIVECQDNSIKTLCDQLFDLYQGAFLAYEPEPAVAVVLRERLRGRFLRALVILANYWEDRGAWQQAIDCCTLALEIEPLIEECYRHLMCCYIRANRPAEAMATYKRCERVLHSVLGIPPSAEMEVLRLSIGVATHTPVARGLAIPLFEQ